MPASFFGYFNLSGKATSLMGTFSFGMVITWTGSTRLAVVTLLVFFVIGLVLLAGVKIDFISDKRRSTPRQRNQRTADSHDTPDPSPVR